MNELRFSVEWIENGVHYKHGTSTYKGARRYRWKVHKRNLEKGRKISVSVFDHKDITNLVNTTFPNDLGTFTFTEGFEHTKHGDLIGYKK